jgi:hypothetical protein
MKKLFPTIALVAITVLILGSCVLPGTGTANVRNRLSGDRQITALYIYPTGSPDTDSEISSPMDYNDVHSEIGLDPGAWTIEAVVDSGAATAVEDIVIEDGVIDVVWIVDSDIVP